MFFEKYTDNEFLVNSKSILYCFSQNQIELVKSYGPYHMGKILSNFYESYA